MKDCLLKQLCEHKKITDEDAFEIASEISTFLNSSDERQKQNGRDLIIELLDNWENISNGYKPIFEDLVSAAGFYPYVKSLKLKSNDLDDEMRLEYHRSSSLSDVYFHSEQKKICELIHKHINVIVSAPTSFGKSMLIEEIVASEMYSNLVIIQPTLALLDETRRKLKKYTDKYKIIVKTSQEYCTDKGNIFLLTAERVLEYPDLPQIQLLILDEFYKLSSVRGDNRNNILNIAFVRIMKNPDCKFYMLGPNVDSIPKGFVEKYNAVFYKTNFSMVVTKAVDMYQNVHVKRGGKVSEDDIMSVLDAQSEQTLIYCASPNTSRNLAFMYCEHLISRGLEPKDELPLIGWINDNLTYRWSLAKCLKYGIAVHDGAMPKHITSSTIQYFNQVKINYLFCTNTIIEGVNTSAKNVIYYDNKIGNRKIDYFDYSNIKGRAGRLMEHYIGTVINLHKPPEKESTDVDFPFFQQNPIESEVLVNLEEKDVKNIADNVQRFNDFKAKDPDLQTLLMRNAVSIEGQERILSMLYTDLQIPSKRELIIWNRIDGKLYQRLQYIFDLCWENLSSADERKSFGSKGWVVNKIVSSCFQSTINDMIERDLEYRAKKMAEEKGVRFISIDDMFIKYPIELQARTDNIIEMMFALQKNWLQYRAPKWINVVDSLQKYVTTKLSLSSGDYSYIAEMIENEFIQSNFRILLEYGLPRSAVQKVQVLFEINGINAKVMSEDDLIRLIGEKKEFLSKYMSPYEMEIINRAL